MCVCVCVFVCVCVCSMHNTSMRVHQLLECYNVSQEAQGEKYH
jgi:hypothetical protein